MIFFKHNINRYKFYIYIISHKGFFILIDLINEKRKNRYINVKLNSVNMMMNTVSDGKWESKVKFEIILRVVIVWKELRWTRDAGSSDSHWYPVNLIDL
jgi:hypothetical protein